MNNLQLATTEKFGELDCNFYRDINYNVLMTREQIGSALEYSEPQKAIDKIHTRHKSILNQYILKRKILKNGQHYSTYLYNLEGILTICELSHSVKASEFANFIKQISKNNHIYIINTRKELTFGESLNEALSPFNIKVTPQYKVLSYSIDYYIPRLNVAIEYDENNHQYYTYSQHTGRQNEIENELGCSFIRVNDNKTHAYNIGFIIKELYKMQLIYASGS